MGLIRGVIDKGVNLVAVYLDTVGTYFDIGNATS